MDDAVLIEIQRLFKLVHDRGLRELSVSRPGFAVDVTAMPEGIASVVVMPMPAAGYAPAPAAPVQPIAEAPIGYTITSPLVGIFYRAPSPDAPNFIEIGDTVEVGQTIGIVEAMKVFNEITTDKAGVVLAIPAESGKLVQVDQSLVVIEPLA